MLNFNFLALILSEIWGSQIYARGAAPFARPLAENFHTRKLYLNLRSNNKPTVLFDCFTCLRRCANSSSRSRREDVAMFSFSIVTDRVRTEVARMKQCCRWLYFYLWPYTCNTSNSNWTNIVSMRYRNAKSDIDPSLVVETRIYIFYWRVDVVRSWFRAMKLR